MNSPIKDIINKIERSLQKVPLVKCALMIGAHSVIFSSIPVVVIWTENIIFGIIPQSVALDNPMIGYIKFISSPTILLLFFISLLHDFTNLIKVMDETHDELSEVIWLQKFIIKIKKFIK